MLKGLKTNDKKDKKVTANDSKSYLPYLDKLVDQYNNTYHHSTNKKPINADYSALIEKKMRWMLKLLSLKLMKDSELLSRRIFLVKIILKIGQEKYLLSIVSKTNRWTYKLKS